jgi:HlyD family secretion protein
VFGTIPTRVKGSGILIATGGRVFDAISLGDGIVAEIFAKAGDTVSKGQIIARIEQPLLAQSLQDARAVLTERRKEEDARKEQIAKSRASRQENNAARRKALEAKLANAEERVKAIELQLQTEEPMFKQHLITWQSLYSSRQELATARQTALDAQSQVVQIDAEEGTAHSGDQRDVQTGVDRVADAERQVRQNELQLKEREWVLSPANGRVTEIKAVPGGRVAAGSSVVSIESGVTGLQALIYLPSDQGKQVRPGMEVRISPSTAKKEEYGTILGRVVDVSDFPSTDEAMQAMLQNQELVKKFSATGPPFAARVDLVRDSTTVSGYRWSGGRGPATVISSGTIADGEVTVRELAPISYVIPVLRKATGMDN